MERNLERMQQQQEIHEIKAEVRCPLTAAASSARVHDCAHACVRALFCPRVRGVRRTRANTHTRTDKLISLPPLHTRTHDTHARARARARTHEGTHAHTDGYRACARPSLRRRAPASPAACQPRRPGLAPAVSMRFFTELPVFFNNIIFVHMMNAIFRASGRPLPCVSLADTQDLHFYKTCVRPVDLYL